MNFSQPPAPVRGVELLWLDEILLLVVLDLWLDELTRPLAGPSHPQVVCPGVGHDGAHVLVVVEQVVVVLEASLVGVVLFVDAQHLHLGVSELENKIRMTDSTNQQRAN